MRNLITRLAILSLGIVPVAAMAHAFLDRAVPGVGATVQGGPSELRIGFTQDVVAALCGVRIESSAGAAVPAAKPTVNPSEPSVLHVRLGRSLAPGTYTVSWHVVSVDTHPTSGTYKFTVAP